METLGKITSGGFGKVEKVKLSSGVIVARKTFAPSPEALSATTIEKLRKRFEREVRIQSSLPPEFFMPVLNSDLKIDPPYFTMPLADRNFEDEIIEKRILHQVPIQGLADLLNALETAELGCSHNRWFVMKRVKSLCGSTLDEKLAERIAIEIAAEEAEHTFISCIETISEHVESYHPAIASVLQAYVKKQSEIPEAEKF